MIGLIIDTYSNEVRGKFKLTELCLHSESIVLFKIMDSLWTHHGLTMDLSSRK